MREVYFTNKIEELVIEGIPEDTLIVVHEMYPKPSIKGQIIDWQVFKATYSNYSPSQYVIVGLNRMITPSNRCDMVNDFLQVMTKSVPKISIDTSPFIGEPWRLWYHYSVVFGEWLGVDYSYPVEGDWQKWFYYEQNFSKLSADNLPIYIKNTHSDLGKLKTEFKFVDVNEEDMEFYEECKKIVFEKYDTPKLLTNNLLKMLNKHFRIDLGFDSYLSNQKFDIPELNIYKYVVEENRRRLAIYNLFTK